MAPFVEFRRHATRKGEKAAKVLVTRDNTERDVERRDGESVRVSGRESLPDLPGEFTSGTQGGFSFPRVVIRCEVMREKHIVDNVG